ncbi:hypothetical protein FACS1894122_00700 [Alphaproteobacteria bacterium]|nr:hypothetical protein FACS1894122_00700 [Alphaproteobacteria bacterium]
MQSFTGHCAHSLDCDKWIERCHSCTYLNTYPAIDTDNSHLIYDTKKKIYDSCEKITVVAVSNWLKEKVEHSILQNHDIRCIYNGVDEKIFHNYNKQEVRKELSLPYDKKIILFCCDYGDANPWKGGSYLGKVYEILKSREDILFLCVGSPQKGYRHERFYDTGFIGDKNLLAKYYSAADLFLYPTIADSFPFVTLESMSCSTPIISFNTGGIPEQISHMNTGYIAKQFDVDDLLNGVNTFMNDDELWKKASILSRKTVESRFTIDICLKNYIDLYHEVIESRRGYGLK